MSLALPGKLVARLKANSTFWRALWPARVAYHRARRLAQRLRRAGLYAGAVLLRSEECVRRLAPDPMQAALLRATNLPRALNAALVRLSSRLRLERAVGRPHMVIFELSNRCTLRCPLCTTGGLRHIAPHVRRGTMRFETFKRGVDALLPCLHHLFLYSWGEPLLNKNVCECIAYATQRNVVTQISTNMQLYSDDLGRRLIEAGLTKLIVSCDGLTQETYEKYRVAGSLDKVKQGVRHLLDLRAHKKTPYPVVEIQCIVFRHNEHELEDFRRYWLDFGADSVKFIRMSFMSREGRKVAHEEGFIPASPAWAPHHPYGRVKHCFDLYQHTSIDWNGDVHACCWPLGNPKYALGNILRQSFAHAWNGPRYRYCRGLLAKRACGSPWYETMCHDCAGIFPSEQAARYW